MKAETSETPIKPQNLLQAQSANAITAQIIGMVRWIDDQVHFLCGYISLLHNNPHWANFFCG